MVIKKNRENRKNWCFKKVWVPTLTSSGQRHSNVGLPPSDFHKPSKLRVCKVIRT